MRAMMVVPTMTQFRFIECLSIAYEILRKKKNTRQSSAATQKTNTRLMLHRHASRQPQQRSLPNLSGEFGSIDRCNRRQPTVLFRLEESEGHLHSSLSLVFAKVFRYGHT